jgi:putative ABC transport system permease protein
MKKNKPPKIATWLLANLTKEENKHSIVGDAEEDYKDIRKQKGIIISYLWYWSQVFISLPLFIKLSTHWSITMFNNYLKTAIRSIRKQKLYSFINIAGLGVGIATSLIIMLWVQDELSYDKFHKNYNNIYRLVANWQNSDGTIFPHARVPYPLGPALQNSYPEVKESLHFKVLNDCLVKLGENNYYEKRFCFADSNFFRMFSFPLIKGDPQNVINDLTSLVISESMATKYFGNKNPIGKILTINNSQDFQVTGIMKDVPTHSHLQFDFIANFEYLIANEWSTRWMDHIYYSYVELAPETDASGFGAKIKNYIIENKYDITNVEVVLQPLKDIYLRSHYANDYSGYSNERTKYIYIFSIVAFIVLLIASINFMNLATAQSTTRAKEIGVRKVSGALKNHLIKQFLSESVFTAILASLFAILLIYLLLPTINSLTGKDFDLLLFMSSKIVIFFFTITLLTGLLAGSYPALYLSSFRPANVLKGRLRMGVKGRPLRRILVIAQFSLSIILLIGTFVVHDQIIFMQNKNLGFNKENIIYMRNRGKLKNNFEPFKEELIKHSDIKNITAASSLPLNNVGGTTGVDWEGKSPDYRISWKRVIVDYDYLKTFGFELIKGRDFSRNISTDAASAFIINETGAKILGFDDPIGKRFGWEDTEGGEIIGVVRDFHMNSLHEKIEPTLIKIIPEWFSYIFVKVNSNNFRKVIQYVEDVHTKLNPDFPFGYNFLDKDFEIQYLSEQRISRTFKYFTIVAVFISCLGLLGLSFFVAEQRTKEIGIRKVFGANVPIIMSHLLKDFIKWVFVANLIAWPIGYYIMNQWLLNFAYRTAINWNIFIFSGFLSILISIITISYKSIHAALANPIDTLKYE